MEMRAKEGIAIGQDLTPPLPPLASVLHDSALSSYCSACFSTLPPRPFPPQTGNRRDVPGTPLYCSRNCSSINSALHFSSAEPHLLSLFRKSPPSDWEDSSDLRLSLRLVHIFEKSDQRLFIRGRKDSGFDKSENIEGPVDNLEKNGGLERIAGLMTNREKLIFGDDSDENCGDCEDSDENRGSVLKKIREGAKAMAKARRTGMGQNVYTEKMEDFVLEEMALCLVVTNAVEVQDKSGCSIGIAVYDTAFSWINHSCSPNACYRFVTGSEHNEHSPLRIRSSYAQNGCGDEYRNGLIMEGGIERNGYGPKVVVRSIKAVKKGEEVTIAYTDLLQPKGIRQEQLWLKYRFSCSCERCDMVPTTYVDYALQALSSAYPDNPDSSDNNREKLIQRFDDVITEYLSLGDPESCCKKLENLLSHGHIIEESVEPKETTKSPQKPKLHPFHHLSLNAYTTLASAYKVHSSDLLALDYEVKTHKLEAFNSYKKSTAYSLLLAGVSNRLFMSESALVATVANFWINAGESLLRLSRTFFWNHLELSSLLIQKCSDCGLVDTAEILNSTIPDKSVQLEEIKSRFRDCIANITAKIWSILASESRFLRSIQDPIDFSWLASSETPGIADLKEGSSELEAGECNEQVRMNLVSLSIHCLRYGATLSSICYGLSVDMYYNKVLDLSF